MLSEEKASANNLHCLPASVAADITNYLNILIKLMHKKNKEKGYILIRSLTQISTRNINMFYWTKMTAFFPEKHNDWENSALMDHPWSQLRKYNASGEQRPVWTSSQLLNVICPKLPLRATLSTQSIGPSALCWRACPHLCPSQLLQCYDGWALEDSLLFLVDHYFKTDSGTYHLWNPIKSSSCWVFALLHKGKEGTDG